jgi:hypothetical protein
MSRPERIATDPFSTVVELTSAALARRPPAEFVYDRGPSFLDRLARLLDRDSLPRPEGSIEAANDPAAGA